MVSGLAAAARRGILIKGGVYLEQGRKLKALALDNTGTLTLGKPAQTGFEAFGNSDPTLARELAASLAARSDHPVSHAVAVAAKADGVVAREVKDFVALPGRGVKGTIGERTLYLGNARLMQEMGVVSAILNDRLNELEQAGNTVVVLADDHEPLALFAIADTVRETSGMAMPFCISLAYTRSC